MAPVEPAAASDTSVFAWLRSSYPHACIARVELAQVDGATRVEVATARPGVLIGRRGETATRITASLEQMLGGAVRLHLVEIRAAEREPLLVADAVAENLARGVDRVRVLDRWPRLVIRAGARAVRIRLSGALGAHDHQAHVPTYAAPRDPIDDSTPDCRGAAARGVHPERGDFLCEVWIVV